MTDIFPELLNKQVCCYKSGNTLSKEALACLQFMYPNFKVVTSEFDIYPDEPFIYIGDIKWLPKINKHTELHINVASTGEYNLTDRHVLLELAYIHHNKWKNGNNGSLVPSIPQYLESIYENWSDEQFYYNWKYLWITGNVIDKEFEEDKLFIDILKNLSNPFELLISFLKASEKSNLKYLESNLLKFIYDSNDVDKLSDVNTKNKFMLNARHTFFYAYKKNISKAVQNLVESPIENQTLRLFNFLKDLIIEK